jgi:hypothetical protein
VDVGVIEISGNFMPFGLQSLHDPGSANTAADMKHDLHYRLFPGFYFFD